MKPRTRVKICGITSIADAQLSVTHGADAIGMVFYPKSPRCVSIARAVEISRAVGPYVNVVALFVDPTAGEVKSLLSRASIQTLQFQGNENADFCEQFSLPYIKAVRVPAPDTDSEAAISVVQQTVLHECHTHPRAQGILLDTYHENQPGGTGKRFDWRCVPASQQYQWILAGGLKPDNVAEAIAQVVPYAVDVCSGVEAEPGKKDSEKLKAFIQTVNNS